MEQDRSEINLKPLEKPPAFLDKLKGLLSRERRDITARQVAGRLAVNALFLGTSLQLELLQRSNEVWIPMAVMTAIWIISKVADTTSTVRFFDLLRSLTPEMRKIVDSQVIFEELQGKGRGLSKEPHRDELLTGHKLFSDINDLIGNIIMFPLTPLSITVNTLAVLNNWKRLKKLKQLVTRNVTTKKN